MSCFSVFSAPIAEGKEDLDRGAETGAEALRTTNSTFFVETSIARMAPRMILQYFFSTHSLANTFGKATSATPSSVLRSWLLLSQVAKFGREI